MSDQSKSNPAATPPSVRMGRGLRGVLIGSLALNLLVVGVVGGGMIAGRGAPHPFGGYNLSLGPFADALEDADRATVRDRLRDRAELRRPDRGERQAAMQAFLTALRQDPFDPAVIEAIFADQRARAVDGLTAGQEVLMERLSAMTPEARTAFADRLERRMGQRSGDGPTD